MIRQEEAVGVAGRAQAGRAPRRAGGRRGRVRLLGLAALVVIGATVSAAVGLPGRLFKTQPRPIVTIAVGAKPSGVAVDPAAHRAYVTNRGDGTSYGYVTVLDTRRNAVVATVNAGRSPTDAAVDPAAHHAYVTNPDGGGLSVPDLQRGVPDVGSISVLDTRRNAVIAAIGLNFSPVGIVLDPTARRAYVANQSDGSISVLDTRRNAVVATVQVGRGPVAVAVDPATHRIYVANQDDGTVSVLEGGA